MSVCFVHTIQEYTKTIKILGMKNLIMTAVIAIGMLGTMDAKSTKTLNDEITQSIFSDEYRKITSSEITPPVVEQLLKEYPTSKLGAAYVNDKGEYKLIMVLKSGSRRTVYIDAYGNWLTKK